MPIDAKSDFWPKFSDLHVPWYIIEVCQNILPPKVDAAPFVIQATIYELTKLDDINITRHCQNIVVYNA